MTNLEALLAEVEPYTPSSLTLEKALVDVGVDMQDTYSDEKSIALATVKALSKMLVLSNESESKFTQSYNDKLEKRIFAICNKYNFDAAEYVLYAAIDDGSTRW